MSMVEEALREPVIDGERRAAQRVYGFTQACVIGVQIARRVEAFKGFHDRANQFATARTIDCLKFQQSRMYARNLKLYGARVCTIEHQQIEHRQPFRPRNITRTISNRRIGKQKEPGKAAVGAMLKGRL